ncbi:MAG: response regulator [Oscillospiraceae bacterium]|nr:response regulator [Oscillospiraceae bacterium]MDY2846640.1 response regulator [Oscillospiraceae bacterium]
MGISLQEKECNLSERIHIPIIAMTANAFEEDKKNAYKAGMNGHIAKPINVNELISTLSEVLGREKSQV